MIEDIRSQLSEDERARAYKRIEKMALSVDDFETYADELSTLHRSRRIRTLYLGKVGPTSVIEVAAQEASVRARCTEIITSVSKARYLLDTAMDAFKVHVLTKYKADLAEYRSIRDRENAVRTLLVKGERRISEFDAVIEQAAYVVEDIDKSGYQIKAICEMLNLVINNRDKSNLTQEM